MPQKPELSGRPRQIVSLRDLIFFVLFWAGLAALFIHFDTFEAVEAFTRRYENYEVDELILATVAGLVAFSVVILIAVRRHFQAYQRELEYRRKAQINLLSIQGRLQAIVDNAPGEIYLKDPEGRYLLVNDKFAALAGVGAGEMIGRTSAQIFTGTFAQSGLEHDKEVVARRVATALEETFGDGDDAHVYLTTKFPVYDENNELIAIGAIQIDVTERKEIEKALVVARDQATASERAKTEFLASMSHEIRTPMTGVLGMADSLLDSDLSDEQHRQVENIKSAGRALITILNDILDLSKIQAGKLEVENIDFDLKALIADSLDLLTPGAGEKNLLLESDIDPTLPATLNGDPTRIRQILINLIGNAIKFTEHGNVTVHVGLNAEFDDFIEIRFEIIDTGIGIATDRQVSLFEDFTQLDASTARKYEGTGLGLAISKRLTELMNGEIGVTSVEGQGSIFWFVVPAKPAFGAPTEPATDAELEILEPARSLDILIAEDNDLNQAIIMAVLDKFDHRVTCVENGRAAVQAVKDGSFDLVLMDIRMPEMDGTDATRIIRQEQSEKAAIPIIAITADALIENQNEYFEAGMNAVVTKPIDQKILMATIYDVVDEAASSG